ncbi:distal membrane-arm assembly complex protein 2 isoform X2 [Lampris incognitus]|uniref:distal membrane-arm assembly complex protein 2 isoform X2 n=1 Tax=Lampris incognitus TaxID=2546036 RepID=UPI0024B50C60|nr:distal membrane-arm assembly complex protein 2 isoform X2 [Lampris incognitus]
MATALLPLRRGWKQASHLFFARQTWNSSPVRPPSLPKRLLIFLAQHFHDVQELLIWTSKFKSSQLRKKNAYYGYTQRYYGDVIASAYYVLSLKGGFRYAGQSEWFHTDKRGKFNWDFLNHKDLPLEEVDMSHTIINHIGLDNLVGQPFLRTLSVRGCSEVDDWFLARLHEFQDTLEELDISHCPRITIGGLAALRNLKKLRHLDVSSLPRIANPGLVIILLEEMLPHCQIAANGYDHSLTQEG